MKYFISFLFVVSAFSLSLYYTVSYHLLSVSNPVMLHLMQKRAQNALFWIGLLMLALAVFLLLVRTLIVKITMAKLKRDFQKMEGGDGEEFEKFLARLLKVCGWKVMNPTSSTNASDQGIDLILDKKVAVQAKNYTQSTGNKAVQEVMSGFIYWKKHGFPHLKYQAVVTTSYFTKQAVDLAKSGKVVLKEGEDIRELLNGKPSKKWILKMPRRFLQEDE